MPLPWAAASWKSKPPPISALGAYAWVTHFNMRPIEFLRYKIEQLMAV
jgi:hypothetical protein